MDAVGHELLEHTADLGIRAWGRSLESAIEEAVLGLAEVMGIRVPPASSGGPRSLRAEGEDDAVRLVALLNDVVFLAETEDVRISGARVRRDEGGFIAELDVVEPAGGAEGIGVKAATYHQLSVEERPDGSAEVRVFVDV